MPVEFKATFARFAVAGTIATLMQYAVLILWVEALHLSAVSGSGCGCVLGAIVSYALNYHFTFRSIRPHRSAAWRFVAVAAIGLLINVVLMRLLNGRLRMEYLLAQVVATSVVLLWNFVGGAFWSFVTPAKPLRETARESSR